MLMRRLRPEVLWLLVAALLFAFFAKTDNAPLGQIYDWMYLHVPGWKLFREGSKFLYIVTLAYAILIPIALASAFEWASANHIHLRARLVRRGAALGLVGVVALSAWSVVVLQSGSLGSTTSPTPDTAEIPVECTGIFPGAAPLSRRNNPNRATANPTPIKPSPVRIHARNVRSAAK